MRKHLTALAVAAALLAGAAPARARQLPPPGRRYSGRMLASRITLPQRSRSARA